MSSSKRPLPSASVAQKPKTVTLGSTSTTAATTSRSLATVQPDSKAATALPAGFFDNKDLDAKKRGLEKEREKEVENELLKLSAEVAAVEEIEHKKREQETAQEIEKIEKEEAKLVATVQDTTQQLKQRLQSTHADILKRISNVRHGEGLVPYSDEPEAAVEKRPRENDDDDDIDFDWRVKSL